MEILFIYILKSSGLIALFYTAYYFLLQKETFFNSNRWFLLAGLFTSALLPLLVYTTIIWVEPTPINSINWTKIPVTRAIDKEIFEINWNLIILGAYTLGILLFLIQFSFDFYNLNQVLKGKKIQQLADHKFIDLKENVAPFSFFNTIVYNSSLYNESEMENILEHEKVHSDQFHTIDVLIARFFCILFWFNPIIWLYKKAMLQNLEFIADSEATKNIYDKKAYQLTLLKITTHENCVAITNHFYQSLIKKRIVMLNKNQSKKWNSWKYALILPVLVAFVIFFQMKVVAQEKEQITASSQKHDFLGIVIENDFKDEQFEHISKEIKQKKNIDVIFYGIKRDKNNKIIVLSISTNNNFGQKTVHEISGDEPIKAFEIGFKENSLGQNNVTFTNPDLNEIKIAPTGFIVSKSKIEEVDIVNEDAQELPTPPTPPTPPSAPNAPNFTNIPVPTVKMPALPKPPRVPSNMNDEKAMKQFDQDMEAYDKKMEKLQPQIDHFEKKMEEYQSKMETLNPNMEKFDKEMEKFDEEMVKFDEEMAKFDQKMAEYHDQMSSQNMRIEKTIVKTNKKVKK